MGREIETERVVQRIEFNNNNNNKEQERDGKPKREGWYNESNSTTTTAGRIQQQQRTRNNMFDLKQECRVETTLSHSKDMTQLENLIHGYKMMNIRK